VGRASDNLEAWELAANQRVSMNKTDKCSLLLS